MAINDIITDFTGIMTDIEKNSLLPGQTINVVDDYSWVASNAAVKNGANTRYNVPYIELREFQPTVSGLIQSISYWFSQGATMMENMIQEVTAGLKNSPDAMADALATLKGTYAGATKPSNPYAGLYIANPTNRVYRFPFYNEYNHMVINSWGENAGPIGNFVNNYIVPLSRAIMPAGGIETAKSWEGTQIAVYNFQFNLFNTINPKEDIAKNEMLIRTLIYYNLQNRINFVAAVPPVLYEITVPGVRYSPAAVISNLTIGNVGQMNNWEGRNVPDAYSVELSIQELIVESRQIFGAFMSGSQSKIKAIVDEGTAKEIAKENLDKGAEMFGRTEEMKNQKILDSMQVPPPGYN